MILNGSAVDGSYWLDATFDLSSFIVPVQGSIYDDDTRPAVTKSVIPMRPHSGADLSRKYAYFGYILMDLWAKAVERAGNVEISAADAEHEKRLTI